MVGNNMIDWQVEMLDNIFHIGARGGADYTSLDAVLPYYPQYFLYPFVHGTLRDKGIGQIPISVMPGLLNYCSVNQCQIEVEDDVASHRLIKQTVFNGVGCFDNLRYLVNVVAAFNILSSLLDKECITKAFLV